MGIRRLLAAAAIALCAAAARGAGNTREPSIGYLYPAGARRGTTVTVFAGGQFLRGTAGVRVSGDGVSARFVAYREPVRRLEPEQSQAIQKRLRQLTEQRIAEEAGVAPRARKEEPVALPDHPLLRNLERLNLAGLKRVAQEFFDPARLMQGKAQIAETAELQVTVDPDAVPGPREVRIVTALGVTNPLRFEVGDLPEVLEEEPNDPGTLEAEPLDLPVLLNGQVTLKDLDCFRFRAAKGQRLVVEAGARRLIPYLADAVPGWFQAVLSLRDEAGEELAFADDWRNGPDPVLFFTVPRDGIYELLVRDAIYRGREDFVYRVAVGELPFVTRMFPLGGREGAPAEVTLDGANLPAGRATLDTTPGGGEIRETIFPAGAFRTGPVAYAVDDLPECAEAEPNDRAAEAQRVALPVIVNGRIDRPGDVDEFRFSGLEGDRVVARVRARRLDSPVDSLLQLVDAADKVVAWNDDSADQGAGLETHHADSVVSARLPADGVYRVRILDAQRHGGPEYAYRLRISPPRPGYSIVVSPSALNVPAGVTMPVTVTAIREDGFEGDIDLSLAAEAPGFTLAGGRVPGGRDSVRVTVTAPRVPPDGPVALKLTGRAAVGAVDVAREAVPADDRMQAFGYRHLVPAREFLAVVAGRGRSVSLRPPDGPVRIPAGGLARVRIAGPGVGGRTDLRFALSDPPKGLSLVDVGTDDAGVLLVLAANPAELRAGYADNLIVDVWYEPPAPGAEKAAKPKARAEQTWLGVLPAIPFAITGQ